MTEQQLRDEIALREASIADAHREAAAGDLSEVDVARIVAREESAILELRARMAALSAPTPRPTRRRKSSRLVIGLLCIALSAVGFVALHLSLRQAGTQATGGVQVSGQRLITQLLTEAQGDVASSNYQAALAAYSQVLLDEPHNPVALTQFGWLEFSAASTAHNARLVDAALADLRLAISVAPSSSPAHLYYAMAAASIASSQAIARQQFRVFLALHPNAVLRAIAAPFLKKFGL